MNESEKREENEAEYLWNNLALKRWNEEFLVGQDSRTNVAQGILLGFISAGLIEVEEVKRIAGMIGRNGLSS